MKKEYWYIIAGLIVLALLYKPVKKTVKYMTRGYKNNNFGNIVKTFDSKGKQTFWTGETTGTDTRFKTFKSPAYGYRAIFVLLDSYVKKGFDTIEEIISKYAPSNENNTNGYIESVSKLTNLQPDEAVTKNDYIKIAAAISQVENGIKPNTQHLTEGFNLFKNG
jgi:hypothetical protein